MKKNYLVLFVLMMIIVLVLSGCGGDASTAEGNDSEEEQELAYEEDEEEYEPEEDEEGYDDSEENESENKDAVNNVEWPKSELGSMIPKYESGNIYAVYEDKTMMSLSITDTEDEYFEEYLEGIKEIFNNNTQESQVDMEYLYLGTDDKGNSIQVLTYEEDKGIVLWPNQDSVDIKIDWPESNLVKIIPEYDSGEILNVAQSEETVTILLEDEDENYFNDYVDNIKKDFDENNFETETDDWYQFSGENGNRKSIGISYDGNNVSVTISHY